MNKREQQYLQVKSQPTNEKYGNGSVGARGRLMFRGGCLPVRGSKGIEWNRNTMMICVFWSGRRCSGCVAVMRISSFVTN